jgi:aspartate racemase
LLVSRGCGIGDRAMKTLGVIGGMGWEASATYYRVMNRQVRARLGGWHSSRLILDSLDFHAIAASRKPHEFELARATLLASAQRLEAAGAEGILIACNTVHRFAESVIEVISVPFLHIADAAGHALVRDGHRRVGLLGTEATMRGAFYGKWLTQHHGLEVRVPSATGRAVVQDLILNELTNGATPQACAPGLDVVVEELARDGCSAVLLACTEFGLAYGSRDEPILQRTLPLYDTAVLHAEAAIEFQLGQA